MPPARRPTTAKRSKPRRAPQTLQQWMEVQYRKTPGLRRRVNALLQEMLREQDAALGRDARRWVGTRGRCAVARRAATS
jgi:hypothetical protein